MSPARRPSPTGASMMSSRLVRGFITGTLALVLAAMPAWASPSPSSAETRTGIPRLVWRDCGDGLECATARVPLDYDRPSGRSIDLSLIRLPATDQTHRIGSLFVNPGGPGNSAIEFVREAANVAYSDGIRARYDIVGMDPRGVGSSTPVRCFASAADQEQFFADYNVLPINEAELSAAVVKVTDLASRCEAHSGWLLPHVSTANVARDLDLLRQAVGDRKLTYVGYSYGTYLGATYANLFPNRVRALVLDANTDPTAYAKGPRNSVPFVRVNAHLASSETLASFFSLCATVGTPRCEFADGGDPAAKFATLAQRLRDNPLVLPTGQRVGYAELVDFTINDGLYNAADYAFAASILQQLYVATTPVEAADALRTLPEPAAEPSFSNVREALFASVCSETRNPSDPFAYADVAARADHQAPYVGSFWTYLSLPCAVWPAKDADRYTGPWRVRLANPALIMNNRFDPSTPHRNAVRMNEVLPGSRLVTVEGWGHTARDTRSACANSILERYLVDGKLPAPGITCQPGIVPFS